MTRAARTYPVLTLDPRSQEYPIGGGDKTGAPLVILVGRVARYTELLSVAEQNASAVFVAPDVQTAQSWLELAVFPEKNAGYEEGVAAPEGLIVHLPSQQAEWRGTSLGLTALELRLLAALLEAPGTAWTFADLSETVWGSNHHGDRSMVRSAVQRLRHKLYSAGVGVRIDSIRGVGFRLVHSSTGSPWPEPRERRLHRRWLRGRHVGRNGPSTTLHSLPLIATQTDAVRRRTDEVLLLNRLT